MRVIVGPLPHGGASIRLLVKGKAIARTGHTATPHAIAHDRKPALPCFPQNTLLAGNAP